MSRSCTQVGLLVGLTVAAGLAAVGATGCQDATHDMQVAALGGEVAGVSPGPTHRSGQPCLICHGGIGPAKLQFSVAGTIFTYRYDSSRPLQGAQVQMEDATGFFWHTTANSAGNFFVLQSDWTPTFPIIVPSVVDPSQSSNNSQTMITHDNRDGSCAGCHGVNQGPDSVGPIYVYKNTPDGG